MKKAKVQIQKQESTTEKQPEGRLTEIETDEVSQVPKGANKFPYLVVKEEGEKDSKEEDSKEEGSTKSEESSTSEEGSTTKEDGEVAADKAEEQTEKQNAPLHEGLAQEKITAIQDCARALLEMTTSPNLTAEMLTLLHEKMWAMRSILWSLEEDLEVLALVQKAETVEKEGKSGEAIVHLAKAFKKASGVEKQEEERDPPEIVEPMETEENPDGTISVMLEEAKGIFAGMKDLFKAMEGMMKSVPQLKQETPAETPPPPTPATPEPTKTPEPSSPTAKSGGSDEVSWASDMAAEVTKGERVEKRSRYDRAAARVSKSTNSERNWD